MARSRSCATYALDYVLAVMIGGLGDGQMPFVEREKPDQAEVLALLAAADERLALLYALESRHGLTLNHPLILVAANTPANSVASERA